MLEIKKKWVEEKFVIEVRKMVLKAWVLMYRVSGAFVSIYYEMFLLCKNLPKKRMQKKEITYLSLVNFMFYIGMYRLLCVVRTERQQNEGCRPGGNICIAYKKRKLWWCGASMSSTQRTNSIPFKHSSTLLPWDTIGPVLQNFSMFLRKAKLRCFVKSSNFNHWLNICLFLHTLHSI